MIHKHHIIPRHAGGTDDPSNIELVTVEDHADKHRILFEKYGRWQDDLAYRTLSGQLPHRAATQIAQRISGTATIKKQIQYGKHPRALCWTVTRPTGETINIFDMAKFCRNENLCPKLMNRASKTGMRHKGYRCIKS